MTTRVDVEEIETTKGEKLLAAVLMVFLLIGLLWGYFHIDVDHQAPYGPYSGEAPGGVYGEGEPAAIRRHDRLVGALQRASARQADRRALVSDRREAYRTALDEGRRDPALRARYVAAQGAYAEAQAQKRAALHAERAARPAAERAHRRLSADIRKRDAREDRQRRHDGRVTVVRRLAFILASLAAAYVALARLRRRRSRYLPTAMAAVAAVALMALVMAVDYLTDYVEITDQGVLVLSLAGAVMTLGAFVALQRYLARRIPERRVRRRSCPFCGYPSGDGVRCEGCGRDVVGSCSACAAPRRVGTRHCGACGAV
jgi:hypothetical protein